MKYQVILVTFDNQSFENVSFRTWYFGLSYILTDKGNLKLIDFMEVEQGGQNGIQITVDGYVDMKGYSSKFQCNEPVKIRTLAIMKKPENAWLWVYMFDEKGTKIASFGGTDGLEENNSFYLYVEGLKRKGEKPYSGWLGNTENNDIHVEAEPSSLIKLTDVTLNDGKKYSGWGYYLKDKFIPHGSGKKIYNGFYAYGNFQNGELNGPAICSHNYYMYTQFFINNRGNGWGLCINGGYLVEFGYYENSILKISLLEFVEWYYEEILCKSGREKEQQLLHMYVSKTTHQVETLLIGYSSQEDSAGNKLPCIGFRFTADGSVWVGNGTISAKTGLFIHFTPEGFVEVADFEDGIIYHRITLQELIAELFFEQYNMELCGNEDTGSYKNINEPKVDFNYLTGEYKQYDDLPF